MSLEDFTTFIVFNPGAHDIAIDSAVKIHKTQFTDIKAMIFKDYGTGAFPSDSDFLHYNSFRYIASQNFPLIYACVKDSTLDRGTTRPLTPSEVPSALSDIVSAYFVELNLFNEVVTGGVRSFAIVAGLALDTQYWMEYIYDATAHTFTVNVYSDSNRATLIGTATRNHNTLNDKRWINGVGDYGTNGGGSLEVYDLDLSILAVSVNIGNQIIGDRMGAGGLSNVF